MLVAALWCCTWGWGREGAMAPASLSSGFQPFTPLPTIKLSPSSADSWVGGIVHTLGPCESLQQTLLWGWEFLLLLPQPPQVFSVRGLMLYFPALEPGLHGLWLGPPAAASPWVLSARLPISTPPTSLGECFFFISLVVGLPYSLIFCQFWLFFAFKLLLPSFGCVRRHSMSTYASILAGSPFIAF